MTTRVNLEAHSQVLQQEIGRVDDDAACLAAIQSRYVNLLPPAPSATTSRRTSVASEPKALSEAEPLGNALAFLDQLRAAKVAQLSAVVDQQEAVASAMARAGALADEVRHRDIPLTSSYSSAPPSAQRPDILPSPAERNFQGPSSSTLTPQAPSGPTIAFDPPLVVGGWRSYLQNQPDNSGCHGSRQVSPETERGQRGPIGFSQLQPSPLRPMLVVLPPGAQTNLKPGSSSSRRA